MAMHFETGDEVPERYQEVQKGKLTDHHVSQREQRLVPLVFGLICMLLSFVVLYLLGASSALIAGMIAVIVACCIALAVTQYWKISLHLVGMAGAVTTFVLLFGPRLLVLSPLVVLVGWARWQVRAHTVYQAIAGTILAVTVTVVPSSSLESMGKFSFSLYRSQ